MTKMAVSAAKAIKLHYAMNRQDPFSWGWRHGYQTKAVCRREDADNYFGAYRAPPLKPEFTREQIDLYMAGREAGAKGDTAALLTDKYLSE
jgi:hypothetical protein